MNYYSKLWIYMSFFWVYHPTLSIDSYMHSDSATQWYDLLFSALSLVVDISQSAYNINTASNKFSDCEKGLVSRMSKNANAKQGSRKMKFIGGAQPRTVWLYITTKFWLVCFKAISWQSVVIFNQYILSRTHDYVVIWFNWASFIKALNVVM